MRTEIESKVSPAGDGSFKAFGNIVGRFVDHAGVINWPGNVWKRKGSVHTGAAKPSKQTKVVLHVRCLDTTERGFDELYAAVQGKRVPAKGTWRMHPQKASRKTVNLWQGALNQPNARVVLGIDIKEEDGGVRGVVVVNGKPVLRAKNQDDTVARMTVAIDNRKGELFVDAGPVLCNTTVMSGTSRLRYCRFNGDESDYEMVIQVIP